MDALILAAGMGTRLRPDEPCKPLAKVCGVSLLELSLRQLASVGIRKANVAIGYRKQDLADAMPAIAARLGMQVHLRGVSDFTRPNGYSVVEGAQGLGEEFLLVMADHILASQVLDALLGAEPPSGGAVLAIDRRVQSPLIDPDDATWVETDMAGHIVNIGKSIIRREAVDCGAFRATQGLLAAIERAIGEGAAGSLSDGMQKLADCGLAHTVDIGDAWWLDVDDARALALANALAPSALPGLFADSAMSA